MYIYGLFLLHDFIFFSEAECFHQLMTREWKDVISTVALTSLATAKYNKIDLLPHTSDLILLNTFLKKEVEVCMKMYTDGSVKEMSIDKKRVWHRRLSRVVLAWVTVFNKRRGNEVAAMHKSSYVSRPDWHKNANEEIQKSLSIAERKMSERLVLSCNNFVQYIYIVFTLKIEDKNIIFFILTNIFIFQDGLRANAGQAEQEGHDAPP